MIRFMKPQARDRHHLSPPPHPDNLGDVWAHQSRVARRRRGLRLLLRTRGLPRLRRLLHRLHRLLLPRLVAVVALIANIEDA